ncbi:MAG: hypothetical protein ACK46Q_08520 [Hyphomonas sp.]
MPKRHIATYSLKTLFRGESIRVVGFDLDRANILMTFTRRAANPPHKPFSPGLAKANGFGFIGFVSLDNHWWQTEEFPLAFDCLKRQICAEAKITAYGTSMGGSGALLASQFMSIKNCIVASPPLIVDQEYAPWEPRFQESWKDRSLLHIPDFSKNQPEMTTVVYDPFHKIDRQHVRHMTDSGLRIRRIPAPFMGHMPLEEVRRSGLYREFSQEMIINGNVFAAREIVRKSRNARGVFEYNLILRRNYMEPINRAETFDRLISKYGPQDYLLEYRASALQRAGRYAEAHLDLAELVKMTGRKKFVKLDRRALANSERAKR